MYLDIFVDKDTNKIIIKTDDPSVKYLLQATREETKYLPWMRKWGTQKITTRLYDRKKKIKGIEAFELGLGWAGHLLNTFKPYMSSEQYNSLLTDAIYSENYRNIPFKELRQDQNEDLLHVLKYKRGLISCYTGYGKTQVIAVLANYYYGLGKSVLIVTPQNKPRDEIVKRMKNLYNLDIPTQDERLGCIITAGLLNRNDVKDPDSLKKLETLWASYDVVLVDEVEYTINDSGKFLYDRLVGAQYMIGFSGTSDKQCAEVISFHDGLSDVVLRNRDLVAYFGPSLVFRMPVAMKIDNIFIKTPALDLVKFEKSDFDEKSNVYLNVMNRLWTSPEICNVVCKIIKRFPKLFIPLNNLTQVLSYWIDNYFIGKFKVILVCSEGYIYYDLQGNRSKVKLDEACKIIENNEVDVILSTSSGWRALDFPSLNSILLVSNQIAGAVLQAVGRLDSACVSSNSVRVK